MPCRGQQINWMNDTDHADVRSESLQAQFEAVHQATNLRCASLTLGALLQSSYDSLSFSHS
jgi:hypothetical protein